MKPIANFKKSFQGLSVQFTDSSFNVPTSWLWNFGDGNTSTSQNPSHTYALKGSYWVVLTATNADGSDTVVAEIIVSDTPEINKTIAQMVLCEIPAGIYVDSTCFTESIKKWQLYLQPLFNPKILDANIFTESEWPPLMRVLISKLLIYEYINVVLKQSVIISNGITQNTVVNTNVNVNDYTSTFTNAAFTGPLLFGNFLINGIPYSSPTALANMVELLAWLNSLNLGTFTYTTALVSLANPNLVTSFTYTEDGPIIPVPVEVLFTASNNAIISTTTTNALDNGVGNGSGQFNIRYIETGPSRVEWFDKSKFWANLFAAEGAMDNLKAELCMWGNRLRIALPMCEFKTRTALFKISKRHDCLNSDYPNLNSLVL